MSKIGNHLIKWKDRLQTGWKMERKKLAVQEMTSAQQEALRIVASTEFQLGLLAGVLLGPALEALLVIRRLWRRLRRWAESLEAAAERPAGGRLPLGDSSYPRRG